MAAIEILAVIFAVLVLIKLFFVLVKPEFWLKVSEILLKGSITYAIIYFVLALIAGYYVFSSLNIIQVGAVMLFTSLLMALGFIPYTKSFDKLRKEILKEKHIFRKNWLSFLIWLVLAIWMIYKVLI